MAAWPVTVVENARMVDRPPGRHLDLGRLYLQANQRDQAREHLAAASTIHRELDMPSWTEQAMAEASRLG